MFDTHTIARTLESADLTPNQVDAITGAIRLAAEHQPGDPATKADLAELKADLLKWMFGIVLTVAGIQTATVIAVLRILIAD